MPNILVNLPPGFYRTPEVEPHFLRLEALGEVRKRSHNTPEEIAEDLSWADAVLMWSWPVLDDSLLDQAPRLKFASQLDVSQIGAEVALRRGLPVSQGRSAWSPAVAEMALTLLLASLRRTSLFHEQMKGGTEPWVSSFPDDIDPLERELTGRKVAIVGFGRIGQRLAELLRPFRCPLMVVDPFVAEEAVQSHEAVRVSLDEAVAKAEAVVLCAASNEGTKKLLSADRIASLQPHAILVNVARASLVDTDALLARLAKGDLTAAVDVFDQEPLPPDHPIRLAPGTLLTPHRAGGIMASVHRILAMLIDDLEGHFEGREQRHPLTAAMIPALDA